MNSPNEFTERYSSMCDEDLIRLTSDLQSLVPNAREALRQETERRHLQIETVDWAAHPAPPSGRATQAMARYRDGYLHARTIDGFGGVVKIVALVIGGLLAFGGFVSCASSANSFGGFGEVAGIMIMLAGLLVGGIGYILGVLVQSAGQSMKAHFDCAVNGSHFLNDDQRAQAMSME
jgi:hypothetical protein